MSHLAEESGKGLYPDAVKVFGALLGQWEKLDGGGPGGRIRAG